MILLTSWTLEHLNSFKSTMHPWALSHLMGLLPSLPKSIYSSRVLKLQITGHSPAGNYMFKVNKRNTRTRCEICSELTIKIP